MTLEVIPLVNAGPTLIANLDDGSLLLLATATVSLGDNLTLVAGAQAACWRIAGRNSAALPLAPGSRPSSPRRRASTYICADISDPRRAARQDA
jgi:hypothetical protein